MGVYVKGSRAESESRGGSNCGTRERICFIRIIKSCISKTVIFVVIIVVNTVGEIIVVCRVICDGYKVTDLICFIR